MINLTQHDSQWGNIKLGTSSRYTIASDGCFITSLAMLSYSTPDVVNEKMIKEGGYSNKCLVNSGKVESILGIPYKGRKSASYEPTVPCIAEVDYNPSTASKEQHFVVCLGFKGSDGHYVLKDPLYNTNQSLSRYGGKVVSWRMFEEVKPEAQDITEDLEAAQTALKVVQEHLESIEDIINSK